MHKKSNHVTPIQFYRDDTLTTTFLHWRYMIETLCRQRRSTNVGRTQHVHDTDTFDDDTDTWPQNRCILDHVQERRTYFYTPCWRWNIPKHYKALNSNTITANDMSETFWTQWLALHDDDDTTPVEKNVTLTNDEPRTCSAWSQQSNGSLVEVTDETRIRDANVRIQRLHEGVYHNNHHDDNNNTTIGNTATGRKRRFDGIRSAKETNE